MATEASITINPTYLDLGTVEPDGIERSYYEVTFLTASQRGQLRLYVYSESDSLMSTDNQEIPISNLKYSINYNSPYGLIVVEKNHSQPHPTCSGREMEIQRWKYQSITI